MAASSDESTTGTDGEAAFWVARLHSDQATSADEAAFATWIAGAPERRGAYEAAERTWRTFDALRADPMARAALGRLRSDPNRTTSRRMLLTGGMTMAAASVAGVALFFGSQGHAYETGVGELRRATLEDGSTISLNTDTRIRVRFDADERRIWLDRGQAHFAVAHDASRPFRVFVGEEEVRALGTAFEVRRVGERMRVILEEGVVAVYRGDTETVLAAEPDLLLRPGQAAEIAPQQAAHVAQVDLRRAGAWRYGQMIFDADPLADAVAEINRYHRRQIVLDDPSLGRIEISGVFQTGRPEAFADVLTSAFPIRIVDENDREIRLAASPARSESTPLSQD
ncbi:MAG: FecR family protein [Hyphomonadaceae bacterium]